MANPIVPAPVPSDLFAVEILIRLYYSPERHPEDGSPGYMMAREALIRNKLAEPSEDITRGFQPTERGKVYIEAIRALPLPELVQSWVMPPK